MTDAVGPASMICLQGRGESCNVKLEQGELKLLDTRWNANACDRTQALSNTGHKGEKEKVARKKKSGRTSSELFVVGEKVTDRP